MVAIGMLLALGGYSVTLWGVSIVTGKNVGLKQLWSGSWPPGGPSSSSVTGSSTSTSTSTSASTNAGEGQSIPNSGGRRYLTP